MAKAQGKADNRQVAVYVRKSKMTETGKSIAVQREKCIALACVRFDVAEADILVYADEGKSGFYADRPLYKQMLRDIEANKIRAVVCYKIDRISRRTLDLLNLVQQMDQKHIAFISVSDREIDTSSRTGKIMIALLSAIAEFERDIIAERITDNMYELAKDGRWLGGECPLGYRSQKEIFKTGGRKNVVNRLVLVEDEQRVVERLFALFLQNRSYSETGAVLNRDGCRTKKRKAFTPVAVKNIIKNPVYAKADEDMRRYFASLDVTVWADDAAFDGVRGIMAYNKTEQTKTPDGDASALNPRYTQRVLRRDITDWIVSVGKHEGIISGADWVRAQETAAAIRRDKATRPKVVSRALLSGLVCCAVCGGPMFVRTESGRRNADGMPRFGYRCGAKYRKTGDCENAPNIQGNGLDYFVMAQLCGIRPDEHVMRGALLRASQSMRATTRALARERGRLRERLSQIEAETQHQTANLRTAPEGVKAALYADIETLHREREMQQRRLATFLAAAETEKTADTVEARAVLADWGRLAMSADYERKLQWVRRIVAGVTVESETVHIYLKGAEMPTAEQDDSSQTAECRE